MAIQWGSWDYGNSSAGFRVGLDVTNTAVSNGSSSVTYTIKVYLEAMYNVNDEMTVTYGGSISGSTTDNLTTGSSGGTKLWATKTYTYNYSTYGSSPGTRTFTASLSGVYNGANPTKSVTVTLPARPYAAPAAPSSVTATRNSDLQATVAWTRNATTGAPYTSVTVQRRKWTGGPGGGSWSAYATVATTSSTATSFVDTGITANAAYQYQIRANNSVGSSAWVAPGAIYTTPAAPSGVSATLSQTGTAIRVDWTNNHFDSTTTTYTIQRSVAGGAFANVVTGLAQGTVTWTDNTPGAGTNQYQVAAVNTSGGTLTSAYAQSNVVSTTVPPLAPTNLSPNGVALDLSVAQVFTWQHNPGGDQAAQSAFILEYSSNGGGTWNPLNGGGTSSTVSSYTVPGGTLANGTAYLWRVRTRGVTAAGYGPNSASASVTGSAKPVATITAPPTTVTTLPMTVTWTYSQAQSSAQAEWYISLFDAGMVPVETQNGTGTTTSRQLVYRPTAGTYTLQVQVRSAAGVLSTVASRTLTISLSPPAHVSTVAEFQPPTGATVLSLTGSAPGGGEVAVTGAMVERRVPGGDWITLYQNVALPNDVVDPLPSTTGVTEYRITAASATPTYRVETIVTVDAGNPYTDSSQPDRQWVLVNYGDNFTSLLRFRSAPKIQVTTGREKDAQRFLGRKKPVPALGEGRTRQVSVGGQLVHDARGLGADANLWDSPPSDWELAGQEAEVVCYRDFTGRRIFGLLGDVGTEDVVPGLASIGFGVTEVDYEEVYG